MTIYPYLPSKAQIEITTKCNLRCRICAINSLSVHKNMSFDKFKHILTSIFHNSLQRVILNGVGEPLLNPQLLRMIKYCVDLGIPQIQIYTNATLLKGKIAKALALSGLTEIIYSFDGGTRFSYEKIRKGAKFNEVVENIKNFTEKSKLPCRLHTVFNNENFDSMVYIPELAEYMSIKNIHLVEFIPFRTGKINTKYYNISNYDKNIFLTIKEKCEARGINLKIKMRKQKSLCLMPFQNIYLDIKGNITPCCRIQSGLYFGNILLNRIDEIWNSKKILIWRQKMLSEHPPDLCKTICSFKEAI